jgi:hypothetical protein
MQAAQSKKLPESPELPKSPKLTSAAGAKLLSPP